MVEKEWVFSLGEALLADKTFAGGVSEGLELFLESSSPRNSIFFLLLDVLAGHVSGVVKQGHVPLHDCLAVASRLLAIFAVDLLVDHALGAQCLS